MRRWASRILQAAVLLLPALAVYAWQTRDLLPDGARIPAPALTLPALDGDALDPAALEGRPAVLYFFAPWCGICSASAPQLRWFDRFFGDSTPLVLVALDFESPAQVREWVRRHDLEAPVVLGDAAAAAAFRIRGFPTYYVLDRQGRIAARDFGFTTVLGLWLRTRWLA